MHIQEQSCLKVFQQCRRKKEKKMYMAVPRMRIQVKKKKKTVSDRVGRENELHGEETAGFSCQQESAKTVGCNSFCKGLFISTIVT